MKMLKTISKTYYPGFQRLFQALLLNFFVPMLSGLSNWVRRLILPPPFNPLSNLLGRDPSPVLLDFWLIMSGTKNNLVGMAVEHFFKTLQIKPNSVLFFVVDDTLSEKTGKKIPGCGWHKDHAHKMANVFGHQWVLSALLYKEFLFPLWAKLYHPKGTKGCGRFQTKVAMVKKMLQKLQFPLPCKVYLLADAWYWSKNLAQACRQQGYHMISQLKSNATLLVGGKSIPVKKLAAQQASYREFSLSLYGKNKTLKIKKIIGDIKGFGKVALVIVQEKRKKSRFLVSTNTHLSALDVVRYYAKRWKIEQMIKDLKQRLGFGDYQTRSFQAIVRHAALSLLAYFVLTILKVFQWLMDKQTPLQSFYSFLGLPSPKIRPDRIDHCNLKKYEYIF